MRKNPLIFVGLFILAVILFIAIGSRAAHNPKLEYPTGGKLISCDTVYIPIPNDSLPLIPKNVPVFMHEGKVCRMVFQNIVIDTTWAAKRVFSIKGKFAASPEDVSALAKYMSAWSVPDSVKLDTTIAPK